MKQSFLPFSNIICFYFSLISCDGGQDKVFNITEPPPTDTTKIPQVEMFLSNPSGSLKLAEQKNSILAFSSNEKLISVKENETFQTIDGFGFALTGGSALHLNSMSPSARNELLDELFGLHSGGIKLSLIRITIGASDLDEEPFSYADTPDNSPDPDLKTFSLAPDQANLIPVLKDILTINPDIKIMASPWSPPTWMKSNNNSIGGSLLPAYYESYANYFVKYFKAMSQEGIEIDFMSLQNEPLHDGNNPSMYMTAAEQTTIIKDHLGPAFETNDISTKVLIYDHNADRTDYPLAILDDPIAKSFVYGSAFHLYGGQISDLSGVHTKHPDKHIYFTEQWYGAPGNFAEDLKWHIREVVIGSLRNWSNGVIEWNLSSNPQFEPHTDGGCNKCLGAISIAGDEVLRNPGYYVIGHVSSFVPPGSLRVNSSYSDDLPNVVFLTPENKTVLLVLNDTQEDKKFSVQSNSVQFSVLLEAGSVATFKWNNK